MYTKIKILYYFSHT